VEVYTGSEADAGTDANVYITVEGLRGDTGKRRLLVSNNEQKFQPGQASDVVIPLADLWIFFKDVFSTKQTNSLQNMLVYINSS